MSEELLKALAERAREEDAPEDPRLEALVSGELSAEDRAALEAIAARDEHLREAVDAYAPLDDAARARIAERSAAAFRSSTAEVTELAARRRRRILPVILGIAAAAALFAVFLLRPSSTSLPPYVLELHGGDRALRSASGNDDPTQPLVLHPDSTLEIVLRPSTATGAGVDARAFAVQGDVERPIQGHFERAPDGALRLSARVRELLPGITGEVELRFSVVPAGTPGTWPVLSRRVQINAASE